MGIVHLWSVWRGHEADEDMARAKGRQLDAVKLDFWVRQLKATLKDADAFKAVYSSITADKTLSTAEVIEIARKLTGSRAKTKRAALASIGQERLRLSHAKAKGESAAKTRIW